MGELALFLACCSTLKACTSPGQHNRAGPSGGDTGKPNPKGESVGELASPLICYEIAWVGDFPVPLSPCYLWYLRELAPRT